MSQQNSLTRRAIRLLIAPLALTVLFFAMGQTAAFAQDTGQISGTVYHDVTGEAITTTFTLFETPARVSLFKSSTYITSTLTDASGHYTFTGLSGSSLGTTYYVTIDNPDELAGFTDEHGAGLVEQTYGSSGNSARSSDGPVCAGAGSSRYEYAQQTSTSTSSWRGESQTAGTDDGPCYGGRDANMDFVDLTGNTTLVSRRYVTKAAVKTGQIVTGVNFAFSHNVVTNLEEEGAGSLGMFIRAANAISGTNAMRFIPVVAPNMNFEIDGEEWWRLAMTGTKQLPTITGDNIIIDGTAYYYRNGTVSDKNVGDVFAATTAGTNEHTIPALARPELEILENLLANESTLEVEGTNVTIRDIAFSSQTNLPAIASYHIRQSNGISLTITDVVMGYDMDTNGESANQTLHGIQTAYSAPTTGSGLFHHNYIASNQTSILLSNSTGNAGNVVAATLGDWTIEENIITGGIRLGAGTDRILIRNNKSSEALIMAQSQLVNVAVGNNTITNNNFSSSSGDSIRVYESNDNVITKNILHNATGSGLSITSGGAGNRISQNSFQNNQGNAIDLGDNGITIATSCTGAGGANGGLGRPVITDAKLAGNLLTATGTYCNSGTFDIEFYKAHVSAGDTGSDTQVAGEGAVYVGKLSGISGGTFSNAVITVPVTASLEIGDKVTALAINTANGNTSEFSVNYDLSLTIQGKVFHDVDGTAASDGPAFAGSTTADIHLYDYLGVHQAKTTLDANGEFIFGEISNGIYYVAINEFRGLATGTVGDGLLQVEQTYGSAGTGAEDSGPICVGAAPSYQQQATSSPSTWTSGAQNGVKAAGPCFGGRSSNASNATASDAPPVGNSEHIIRIQVQDANVLDVAFGFSANVVTNMGTDFNQGTLASYLKLANTLSGTNVMRFVPAQAPNQINGADKWWQLSVLTQLPQITDAETTVSGIAYSNTDGATILNTNTMTIGTASGVGVGADGRSDTGDEAQLSGMSGPELVVKPSAAIAYGFDVNANNVTIQNLAIYGFGSSTLPNGAANFGETGNIMLRNSVSDITVKENVVGATANSFTDPGTDRTKGSNIIFEGSADSVTINDNLIGFAGDSGLLKYAKASMSPLTNVTIMGNEIRGNGVAPANTTQGAGVELNNATLAGSAQTVVIKENLIVANATQGIQLDYGNGITIKDNTIEENGASGTVSLDERQNIQIVGGQNIGVEQNIITGSVASDGIELRNGTGAGATPATKVRISRNQFGENRGQAINLLPDGVNLNNGNCAEAGQQNMLVDYPVLTLAEISDTTLNVNGSSCAGISGTVEVYKVAANSGQGDTLSTIIYGEGGTLPRLLCRNRWHL